MDGGGGGGGGDMVVGSIFSLVVIQLFIATIIDKRKLVTDRRTDGPTGHTLL